MSAYFEKGLGAAICSGALALRERSGRALPDFIASRGSLFKGLGE